MEEDEDEALHLLEEVPITKNVNYTYCGPSYDKFWSETFPPSTLLTVNFVICLYGIFANILCLIVFTRKKMKNPTNLILAGISFSDFVVMCSFLPVYLSRLDVIRLRLPYAEPIIYVLYHHFLQIFHTISVWLTVLLAIYRYVAVLHPLQSRAYCTMRRTKMALAIIVTVILIFCIPFILSLDVHEVDSSNSFELTDVSRTLCPPEDVYCPPQAKFVVGRSHFARSHDKFIRAYKFWFHGIICRILPSIILTYVSVRLIKTILRSQETRKQLLQPEAASVTPKRNDNFLAPNTKGKVSSCLRQILDKSAMECQCHFDKTTKMLTVILVIFLVTEFPPGLLVTVMSISGPLLAVECFRPVRFICLMLIILSGALNFPVYLTMSSNFRQTLVQLFSTDKGQAGSGENSSHGLEKLRDLMDANDNSGRGRSDSAFSISAATTTSSSEVSL